MQDHKEIQMLPAYEWKAYRLIHFTIEGVKATIIYQRKVELEKIIIDSEPDPFWKGRVNRIPALPLDDLDNLLLGWVKDYDNDASIEHKFFMFQESEDSMLSIYRGLPSCFINLLANPTFGDRMLNEILKFDGQIFTQYSRRYSVHLFGHIPSGKDPVVIAHYDATNIELMDEYMKRLDDEINVL